MSILKIEWLCIQERWNPKVVIILDSAACYRRATVGSSHDDVHPDNPALHTGAVRPHPGFVESLFLRIVPQRYSHASVRNAARFLVYFVGVRFCGVK